MMSQLSIPVSSIGASGPDAPVDHTRQGKVIPGEVGPALTDGLITRSGYVADIFVLVIWNSQWWPPSTTVAVSQ
jgi:hypothetical protein